MKKFLYVFFVVFIYTMFLEINYSQNHSGWTWQNPLPQGNALNFVEFANSNVGYAYGYPSLIKTTNGGSKWFIVQDNINQYMGWSFVIDENTVVSSISIPDSNKSYIIKTIDGANSWSRYSIGPNFQYICFDFINSSTGYCLCYDSLTNRKIYKTINGGQTWNYVFRFNNNNGFKIRFYDENTGYIAGRNGFIGKTTNGGNNWTTLVSGVSTDFNDLELIFGAEDVIVVGNNGKVSLTTNGGANWSAITSGTYETLFEVKFNGGSNGIVVGDGSTVLTTTSYGVSWTQANIESTGIFWGCSYRNPAFAFVVGENGMIFKSQDLINWSNQLSPITNDFHSVYFTNMNHGCIVGDSGLIYITTNGGSNWSFAQSNTHNPLFSVHFTTNNTGFCVGYNSCLKTTNGGNNWFSQNIGANTYFDAVYFYDQLNGYITEHSGIIYRTTNGGINWNETQTSNQNMKYIKFLNQNTGIISGNSLLRTTNAGMNWVSVFNSYSTFAIDIVNENLIYVGTIFNLLKSVNGGLNWTPITIPVGIYISGIYFTDASNGIVSDLSGTIKKTTNGGANWKTLYRTPCVSDMQFVSQDVGYCVGFNGTIIKTTSGGEPIGIKSFSLVIPKKYSLSQNYPNPFNPVTNIAFDIPKNSNVKLIVYDLLGQEITVLINEEMKPGSYNVDWDASAYPSGVYFYKLIAGDYTESKKMVLVK